ncbi:hypothetical protein Y032_0166g76 [Ancylostoma ceylanicum]|uniref:Transmembrane protein 199 n=2 Tax=Ancylostoma ceylanicum TaxID=53326 RepID=A0A016SX24_9BILA|nr:hypothetical protein Y032_0166g76 [Ancylostoma ceylanicum]
MWTLHVQNMEWIVTEDDRKRLKALEEYAKGSGKEVLRKMAAKKFINMKDIEAVKEALPADAPVFVFYSKLTPYREDTTYKASPEFRAKTEQLRKQQENMAYKKIVQSVDASQKYGKVNLVENFGAELKVVNRQLISIFNVVITVVGAFFFGFSGVQFAYPHLHLDLATRFIIGLVPATIVFFADLYFVIKNMDQDDSVDPCSSNVGVLNFKEMSKKND